MKYTLREYQEKASIDAVTFFQNGNDKNALMVLPTGSGKSLIIADIAKKLNEPILIFQPTKEILEQNLDKLYAYGISDVSIYSASLNSKQIGRITLATIGSVKSKPELFNHFKYVIVDECHFVNAKRGMYKELFEQNKYKIIGLTATPYRLVTDGFGGSILKFLTRTRPRIFHELIHSTQIGDLFETGYLAKLEYHQVKAIDTSKLRLNSTGADYTDKSVLTHYEEIRFKEKLTRVVERLIEIGKRNILIFTRFVAEAQYLVEQFNGEIQIVTAKTKKTDRENLIADFKSGKIKAIANVGILTTGFDFPELETVVLARPTRSLALYYQMIGRSIRPHEKKPFSMVIDLGGNYARFGEIEDLKLICEKQGLWFIESKGKQLTNVYYD